MRAAVFAVAAALCGPGALFLPAAAQDNGAGRPDVTGSWTFIANVHPACTFTGTATLTATDNPNLYGCELTANQICEPDFDYSVRQTCTARRVGNQLSIRSEITEFLRGEPSDYYFPDNFSLSIKSGQRMFGALISSASFSAEFIRSEDGIS